MEKFKVGDRVKIDDDTAGVIKEICDGKCCAMVRLKNDFEIFNIETLTKLPTRRKK